MTVSTTWVSPLSGTIDLSNGAIVSESNWDALASDLLALGGTTGHIGARAYNSANISIPNNTDTAVTLNSETYDTDPSGSGIHDTGSNTSRMTIRTAGTYYVLGCGLWAASATGERLLKLKMNGSTEIGTSPTGLGSGAYTLAQLVAAVYGFSAGDYVELIAYQDSGGALNLNTNGVMGISLLIAKV